MTPLESTVMHMTNVIGNEMFGYEAGNHMACSEANAIAEVMAAGGYVSEAASFLYGHIRGGDNPEDDWTHTNLIVEDNEIASMDNVRRYINYELIGE